MIKCNYCQKEFDYNEIMLPFSNKNYHRNCLIEHFQFKSKPRLSKENSINKVELIEQEEQNKFNEYNKKESIKIKNAKNILINKQSYNKIYAWIKNNYDISIDRGIEEKLKTIVNGTYKGLKEGISYEDLLYMFEKRKPDLDKTFIYNQSKGKKFEDNRLRFHYDLAIIVSKYDGYKKWKEKQKIEKSMNKEEYIENERIRQNKYKEQINIVNKTNKNNSNINVSNEIFDLLDEMF